MCVVKLNDKIMRCSIVCYEYTSTYSTTNVKTTFYFCVSFLMFCAECF